MQIFSNTFEENKEVYVNLASASEITVQADKNGIGEDAVSVVIPGAVVYLPLEDLVDFEKEKERLNKEKDKLTKELARSKGMLSNEKFLNNAKPEKVQEEKDKLAKYEQMMAQVAAASCPDEVDLRNYVAFCDIFIKS